MNKTAVYIMMKRSDVKNMVVPVGWLSSWRPGSEIIVWN
jgi:hypothetical protein